jgi:Fe-S cluster biosynthesis and repair protein YggX
MVECVKFGKEAEGLDRAPFPGPVGQKIYDNVSKEAWQAWLQHQTMVINENRLTPFEPEAKKLIAEEREKFLFGEGAVKPEGYVAPKEG